MKTWQIVVILGLMAAATGFVFLGYERCIGGFVPIAVTEQNGSVRTFTGVETPVCTLLVPPEISATIVGLGAVMMAAGAFLARRK